MSDGIDWNAKIGPWELRDAVKITEELNNRSERSSVLLGGAVLERAVIRTVSDRLSACSSTTAAVWIDHLDREPAHKMRQLALLLGILDTPTSKALGMMAKIRNRFAHQELPYPINSAELDEVFRTVDIRAVSHELANAQNKTSSPEHALFVGATVSLWRIVTFKSND